MRRITAAILGASCFLMQSASHAIVPLPTTYQGELRENGVPREGTVDIAFFVFDITGASVQTILAPDTPLTRGLFSVNLYFDSSWVNHAEQYFLRVAVRDGASSGGYQVLEPDQPVGTVPFASNAEQLGGKYLSEVMNPAGLRGFKSVKFSSQALPAGVRTEIATITLTMPQNSSAIVRGRGYCTFANGADAADVELSIGRTPVDVSDLSETGVAAYPPGAGNSFRSSFSAERVLTNAAGAQTYKLYADFSGGNPGASCRGTLSADSFTKNL